MQSKREIEKLEFEYYVETSKKRRDEIKENLEYKKEVYAEYIDIAIKFADDKISVDELKKITTKNLLVGSDSVANAVSEYLNEIYKKEISHFCISIDHDKYICKIINEIRKDINPLNEPINVHLARDDINKELQ